MLMYLISKRIFVSLLIVVLQLLSPIAQAQSICIDIFKSEIKNSKITTNWQQSVWDLQNKAFVNANKEFLTSILDSKENSPLLMLMKEAGLRRQEDGNVFIPNLRQIHDAYLRLMSQAVKDGRIKEDDILMPVMLFAKETNGNIEVFHVPLGGRVPNMAKPFVKEVFPKYFNMINSDKEFFNLVRNRMFPVAYPKFTLYKDDRITDGMHDFVHLSILAKYPEISPYMMKAAAHDSLRAEDVFTGFLSSTFFVNEMLVRVERDPVNRFLGKFRLDGIKNKNELISELQRRPQIEIEQISNDLKELLQSEMESLGGVTADMVSKNLTLEMYSSAFLGNPYINLESNSYLLRWLRHPQIQLEVSRIRNFLIAGGAYRGTTSEHIISFMRVEYLAESILHTMLYSRVTPVEWFASVDGAYFGLNTKAYKTLEELGLIRSRQWTNLRLK